MSAQFCLATALARRHVRGVDLQRWDDPNLQQLIDRCRVIPDPALPTRAFVLEVDCTNGQTLRRESVPGAEPFNWSGNEVADNLRAMQAELPLDAAGLEHLIRVVLDAQAHSAADIVDACVAPR